jgi:hypothetical protein
LLLLLLLVFTISEQQRAPLHSALRINPRETISARQCPEAAATNCAIALEQCQCCGAVGGHDCSYDERCASEQLRGDHRGALLLRRTESGLSSVAKLELNWDVMNAGLRNEIAMVLGLHNGGACHRCDAKDYW